MTHNLASEEYFDIVRGNQTVRIPFAASEAQTVDNYLTIAAKIGSSTPVYADQSGVISLTIEQSQVNGLNDTLDALIDKVDSSVVELKGMIPYALVEKEIENGSVTLDDRADNYVDARTLGSSDSLDIDFPIIVDGKSRDFVLAVECGENPPTISYAAFATIMAEDPSILAPEQGMNIYSFTEFKPNMFLAARKTVDTVVVNTPESADQLLLAMQKRGIDTTNITDFGGVAETLGLGDTDTPQDAIDAVMN